jgi:hypothetical protein
MKNKKKIQHASSTELIQTKPGFLFDDCIRYLLNVELLKKAKIDWCFSWANRSIGHVRTGRTQSRRCTGYTQILVVLLYHHRGIGNLNGCDRVGAAIYRIPIVCIIPVAVRLSVGAGMGRKTAIRRKGCPIRTSRSKTDRTRRRASPLIVVSVWNVAIGAYCSIGRCPVRE